MAFMEPQVEHGQWYEVETIDGTEFIPADVVNVPHVEQGGVYDEDGLRDAAINSLANPTDTEREIAETTAENQWAEIVSALHDYCEGKPLSVCLIEGWGARMTAPGYLDCTDWCVFDTEEEASEHLRNYYDIHDWEVIVDNVGSVYDGYDEDEARKCYETYCKNTQAGTAGWGLSKGVTLWCDGEPEEEFVVAYATIVTPKHGVLWTGQPEEADKAFKMLRDMAMEESTPIALLSRDNDPETTHPWVDEWWSPHNMNQPIRVWHDEDGQGFFLAIWDKNITRQGRTRLSYKFWHHWELIFEGDDFCPGVSMADDSNAVVGALLGFLSLKPGDTDREYFADYTPRQMEWCQEWGETLSMYVHDLEEGK